MLLKSDGQQGFPYEIPMGFLLIAGINDLLKGGTLTSLTNSILRLKNTIDDQNALHPDTENKLVVATVLNPPKLTWFSDNGPPPPGHVNRLEEIRAINTWITEFNEGYGNTTPRFHRYGVRCDTLGESFLTLDPAVTTTVPAPGDIGYSLIVGEYIHTIEYISSLSIQ